MTAPVTDADQRPEDEGGEEAAEDERAIKIEELGDRAIVRLPRGDGPAWEVDLVRAAGTSERTARARLLADVPELDRALAAGWATDAFDVEVSQATIDALALPELFDELVAAHELRPERLQATDGTDIIGSDVGFGTFVPGLDLPKASPARVAANVAAGGGVTIFGVDDHSPVLARWFEQWDRAVGMACRGDLSLVGRGFGAVAPANETGRLVIAAEGAAHIRVWPADEGVDDRPLVPAARRLVEPTSEEGLVVEPGLAVCVPPGSAMQIGWADPSAVVLTLVVPRMTIGRLLTLVQADATYWPMLRGDVPWDLDAPVRSWGGSTHDPGRGLTASMIEVLDTVPLDRIRARLRAQLIPRSVASFTLTAAAYLSPQPRVRCPVPGFSIYDDATLPVPDGSVALAGGGRRIVLPESTARVLAGFADGAVHLIDDAVTTSEQLDADQVLRAVDDLLDVGLLEAAS